MNRSQALKLLHENMQNINLRKHCYAVEAVMRALYKRLEASNLADYDEAQEEKWAIAGLIHDADYELTKDNAKKDHIKKLLQWLKELDAETDIYDAVASHGWGLVDASPKPKTKMQWALYCCDELTGLIVAVALVKPEKRLASVTVDSILHKWKTTSFAAGVDRKQIEQCTPRLGMTLRDFIDIALTAMQEIHDDLGL